LSCGYGRNAEHKKLRDEVLLATLKKLLKPARIDTPIRPLEWQKAWHHGGAMARADALRQAMWRVSRTARGLALCQMAKSGEPDHTELLRVAIDLCRQAAAAKDGTKLFELANRYRVLMVDEVQDTNPDQLSLYKAFQGMRAQMSVLFVGDVRQSIYRFRRGDPEGWAQLIDATPEDQRGELDKNYRSSHALVEFQRCFFERLSGLGEHGVAPLGALQAHAKAGADAPNSAVLPEPIVVVDLTKDDDAKGANGSKKLPLAAFARRLGKEWQVSQSSIELPPGAKPDESAAVLVGGWAVAAQAARELAAYGIQAQVVGDKSLLSSRAATDLRLWLRALLDVTDDIAWMGLLKHPSIGLTDGALAHLKPFGRMLMADNDEEAEAEMLAPLADADAARLRAVIPVLAQRRRRIGRESTAVLLEELIALFHWRPMMSAGPEGMRAVAELDILLDVVRTTEANGVDPEAVVTALRPGEGDTDKLAKVRLQKAGPTVEITTFYTAKGLEYDHVCVLQTGKKGDSGVRGSGERGRLQRVGVIESPERHCLAVKLDPTGALVGQADPLTGLAKAVCKPASREEGFRFLYVALTRAAKTLTFGVPPADDKRTNMESAIRRALGLEALAAAKGEESVTESLLPGVMVLRSDEPEHEAVLQRPEATIRTYRPIEDTGGIDALWAGDEGRDIRSPSSWSEGKRDGGALKATYLAKAQLVSGSKPAPKLPLIAHLHVTSQGDLVHGWLEAWAFDGPPTQALALEFLQTHWNSDDAKLAQDLCDIGAHMLAELPAFAEMVNSAKALHFELPLLAEVDGDILTGLADLVVDHEDGTTTVIDFKAGDHFAVATADGGIDVPGISGYCWQLEAYKTALESAGRTVKETGLVYVRGPSWVRF
jgi:ATP-dependent exoDNAse (exonuclease V) beta subunit